MTKYSRATRTFAKIAVHAAENLNLQPALSPRESWDISSRHFYPKNVASMVKGSPRATFLSLCELGLIKGVAPGSYTRSVTNKNYAIRAIELLKLDPKLTESQLWSKISFARANNQMDVVKALFSKGYISE
ncbi:hypothetical protein RI844_09730 [Thalassotalea fonticola]|uniref:Uncharacterized protein n=1 Tax=Thalassotalea fonticola TaxID=3065649 RepID=A0ABZ0GVM0_9GAMM|nr:hypothetical protein RI844_09730 [Colwelliaceae bacterium S1-1]